MCIRAKIEGIPAGKRIEKTAWSKNISYEFTDANRRTKSGRHTSIQKRIRRKIKSNKKGIRWKNARNWKRENLDWRGQIIGR